jgi:threonine aldolase
LKDKKVLAMALGPRWRFVTHHDVDAQDCERALAAFKACVA